MAVPNILGNWKSKAIGGIMAGIAAITPAAAFAQEAATSAQPVSMEKIEVPLRDGRGAEIDAIQASAAVVSNDAQTIVLYGPTNETFNEVIEAARQVIHDQSTALNGVIVADPTEYGTEVAIYVDGQLSATIINADGTATIDTLSDEIEGTLIDNYNEILMPRRDGLAPLDK